jgi:MarR family transcriptional regulator, organic hydroperoxide resistance regulator
MENLLKLSNQICFPIYVLSKEITNMYRPLLDKLELTYPQYLVMMVLWEHEFLSVGQIGELLRLDTGTLTPLLKRLEAKELVLRRRSSIDERIVTVSLTDKGKNLKKEATCVPVELLSKINIPEQELEQLKQIINKILNTI